MSNAKPSLDWPLWWLAVLLAWAPLPLGSNRGWSMALLALGVAVVLVAVWWRMLGRGQSPTAYLAPAWLPLTALVLYCMLVAGQWWGGLSGLAAWGWGSVDPFSTHHYLLRSLTLAGLFTAVLLVARHTQAVRLLALVLVGSGILQAVLAIVLLSVGAQYHFAYEAVQHGGKAIGTFVNRNHLAGYLYLTMSVGIGLLLGGVMAGGPAPRRWRDHVVNLLKFMLSARMALRVLLVVAVIALVLTRSRMGNAAFFSSLIILGAVVAVTSPALRGKALLLVASLVIVDILVIGQWVGLDRVVQRLDQTALAIEDARGEETVEARLEPARHTVPMVAERPWLGYGGGSYYTAFPPFKSREMLLHLYYFDHAHNDYAEIAADTGLVGLGLLAVVVLATLWRAVRLVSRRQAPLSRGMGFAGVMAISCILIHSMVDFNLQIMGNAFTFTAILALVWASPLRRPGGDLALPNSPEAPLNESRSPAAR